MHLIEKLHEGIGLAVDEENGGMFFTDLLGGAYSANLDGSGKEVLHTDLGDCTVLPIALNLNQLKSKEAMCTLVDELLPL